MTAYKSIVEEMAELVIQMVEENEMSVWEETKELTGFNTFEEYWDANADELIEDELQEMRKYLIDDIAENIKL